MGIYRIADVNIKFETKSKYINHKLKPYMISDEKYDCEITISKEDIIKEQNLTEESNINLLESTALLRHICNIVLKNYNGMFLHCAVLKYNGKAYIFTAPSGTGKTTHIRLWLKYLGDRVEVINGDKPILRKIDDEIIAYGTPWNGKEDYGNNINAPLGGIFLLHRAEKNSIERATTKESFTFLFSQTLKPNEKADMIKLFDLLEYVIKNIPVYNLNCNMEKQAMETALSVIDKE